MRILAMALMVAACGSKDAPNEATKPSVDKPRVQDAPEFKAAGARISEFRTEGYDAWSSDNPASVCPPNLGELTRYMKNKDPADPWGHPYWVLCDTAKSTTLAVRVASSGPDAKPFTDDDVIGTFRAHDATSAPVTAKPHSIAATTVTVSALDLVRDYKADDISADDNYRKRVLLVTGELGSVGKDLLGMEDPTRVIFSTKLGEASAIVGPQAKSLKAGQRVTLRCTGQGFQMETPMLADCAIE